MDNYKNKITETIKRIKSPDRFCISKPSKISANTKSAFSLPAGLNFSCPGETDACKDCYATKRRHLFTNVQEAFVGNWKIIRGFEKKNDSNSAIIMLSGSIPSESSIFRIHESGDFYSQWYINVWNEVIKRKNNIRFWAYTRSFKLDFKNIIKNNNFVLWASADNYNLNEAIIFVNNLMGVKYAYGPWEHNKNIPNNSFICPVTDKKLDVNGACEKCKLCVVKGKTRKNVVFLKH